MNVLGKPFRKKFDPKNRKNCKIKVKLPHVNKKTLARKRIFVQTPFSQSTLNLERKNFTPQNHSLFRSTSCFGVTKINTPIWLQKSWKCVNRSYKKKTAPQYNSNSLNCKKDFSNTPLRVVKKRQRPHTIQILWIVKKTKRRPRIAPAIAVRLLKKKFSRLVNSDRSKSLIGQNNISSSSH